MGIPAGLRVVPEVFSGRIGTCNAVRTHNKQLDALLGIIMKKNLCILTFLTIFCLSSIAHAQIYCDDLTTFESGSIASPPNNMTLKNISGTTTVSTAGAGTWQTIAGPNGSLTGGALISTYVWSDTSMLPASVSVGGMSQSFNSTTGYYQDLSSAIYLNSQCTGNGLGPGGASWPSCTGPGTGTYSGINASCTGAGESLDGPVSCCTAAGAGTCKNSNCIASGSPWMCCTGQGTGTCGASGYSQFTWKTTPSAVSVGMFVEFNLTGTGEYDDNLPVYGIATGPNASWCNFNIYLPNPGGSGAYVRTESSPGGPNPKSVYGAVQIPMANGYTYWTTMQYIVGSGSANGSGLNAQCTGNGLGPAGANWPCCTALRTGTCGMCSIAVFDPATWTQVGETSTGPVGNVKTGLRFMMGRTGNGHNPWSAGSVLETKVVMDVTNAEFPLGPLD